MYNLLKSDEKWLRYTRLKSTAKSVLRKLKLKFSDVPEQRYIVSSTSFLNITYYINNHTKAIFYFIFVITNKNRCKKQQQ